MRGDKVGSLIAIAFGLFLLAGESAFARGFYFDNESGNDLNEGLAPSHAWKSFRRLNSQSLRSGDTLYLLSGSVWKEETLKLNKIKGLSSPIVIAKHPLKAQVLPKIIARGTVVLVDSSSNLIISGIEVEGSEKACIEISENSSAIQIEDVKVSKCGIGVKLSGQNVVLRNSQLSEMHMIRNTKGEPKSRAANDDYGAIGVVLKNVTGCLIENNFIQKCRAQSHDYGFDGGAVEIWKNVKSCEIRDNRSLETDGFIEFGGSQSDSVVDIYIHHNFAREVGSFSWIHGVDEGDIFGIRYRNIHFYHNTAITLERPSSYFIGIGGPKLVDPQVFASNNLIISNKLASTYVNEGGVGGGRNLFWSPASKEIQKKVRKTDLWGQPAFVDSVKNNYRLVRNSLGAEVGMELSNLPGASAPKGPKKRLPDIGCFGDSGN